MTNIEGHQLKQILQSIESPEALDEHAWTESQFVADYLRNNPERDGRSPGRLLLLALAAEFQRAQPAGRSAGRGRLHTQWLQYGILAARYFAPILEERSPPPSLADAWKQINPALRTLAPQGDEIVAPAEPPLSTLSDWHTRGLRQFENALAGREKVLAAQSRISGRRLREPMRRRQLALVSAAALLLLVAGIGWKVARVHDALAAVRQNARALMTLIHNEPGIEEIQAMEAALPVLKADLNRLEDEIRPVLPLGKYLRWVPTYGATLYAAEPLLDYSRHLLNSLEAALEGGRPLLAAYYGNTGGVNASELLAQLVEGSAEFDRSRAELELALAARAQFDPAGFTPEAAEIVSRMERAQTLLTDGLVVAGALPQLFGADAYGPQTYLVLLQNEDELRATGGLITGLGLVTIQNGEVLSFRFEDSPEVDNPDLPYNRLPWQMVDYMDGGVWLMRDANWSPDFPQVARFAETLYAYSRLHSVDGVVAVDQAAIARLLAVLGPVEAGGLTVSAGDVVAILREQKYVYRDLYGSEHRKDFLGVLGAAMLERIQQDPRVPWTELARTMVALMREKHILVQVDAPEITALLARQNLDGAVRPPASGDYLMVVEANLGFNKVNAAVETRLTYTVDLRNPTAPMAEIRAAVTNTNTNAIACRQIQPLEGTGYGPLVEQCYWNYLRVFTALGTELLGFDAQAISGDWLLTGMAVEPRIDLLGPLDGGYGYGTLMVVPTNRTLEAGLQLALPGDVLTQTPGGWTYALRIQKQPGKDAVPLTLTILLPTGAAGVGASPQLVDLGDGRWQAELALRTDLDVWLTFSAE